MLRIAVAVPGIAALIALSASCALDSSTPLTPTATVPTTSSTSTANATTLKVSAPTTQSPVNDQRLGTTAATLTAGAATPTFGGSAPAFSYHFQVFDASNTMVQDAVSGSNVYTTTASLAGNARFTWRVRAEYQGGVGPWSGTASFFTPLPFNMAQAIILNNPPDLASFAEITKITSITFNSDALLVDFDARNGPDAWQAQPWGIGGIHYTLGLCFNEGGQWYCSASIEFWPGRDLEAAGAPSLIPQLWYYDPARWAPMTGYLPANGETVGVFVVLGDVRNVRGDDGIFAKARSNVQLVPFDAGSGSSYSFANGVAKLVRAGAVRH